MSSSVAAAPFSSIEETHYQNFRDSIFSCLRHYPLALSLRELNRLLALEASGVDLLSSVLDVGCGDGFWWSMIGKQAPAVYGIDLSLSEIQKAQKCIEAKIVDIERERPFPSLYFKTIIGNSSLEHVRDIDSALKVLHLSAESGARLLLFVPTPAWAYSGFLQQMMLKHLPRIAMAISGAINGFFQHWHLYSIPVWEAILKRNGWRLLNVYGLGNRRASAVFRLFLPFAFIAFLIKSAFGAYPNRILRWLPDFLLLPLVYFVGWSLDSPLCRPNDPHAYEYFFVAEADVNIDQK